MSVRRIVPNLIAVDPASASDFYQQLLGLEVAMDMAWIITLAAPDEPALQLSRFTADARAPITPAVSIEVDDVDAVHAEALRRGDDIVYPLTDEPWGVRRFFVRDPAGNVINILSHATGAN